MAPAGSVLKRSLKRRHTRPLAGGSFPLIKHAHGGASSRKGSRQSPKSGIIYRIAKKGSRPTPSETSKFVKYPIRDLALAAENEEKQGKEVLRLNIGDPSAFDFRPPNEMLRAAADAMLTGTHTGYAHSCGILELRELISGMEGCSADEVFITQGLSEGVNFALRILLDPGDSVLFPNPTYPLYPTIAGIFGIEPRYYECDGDGVPDVEYLKSLITNTTRAIVVINPNNPTGAVYPLETLRRIADIAAEHKLPIFADEIYDLLLLGDARMHNLRDIAKDTIVFSGNGFSKNFLYPGARLGWVAIHNDKKGKFLDAMRRMCNQRLSVNAELQRGGIAALNMDHHAFRRKHLQKLRERRDILCNAVAQIPGLSISSPNGAFYGWIRVEGYHSNGKHHILPDWNFALDFLKTEGVLVVPGSAFLKNHKDEVYLRTTFLPDKNTLATAMEKLERFVRSRLK